MSQPDQPVRTVAWPNATLRAASLELNSGEVANQVAPLYGGLGPTANGWNNAVGVVEFTSAGAAAPSTVGYDTGSRIVARDTDGVNPTIFGKLQVTTTASQDTDVVNKQTLQQAISSVAGGVFWRTPVVDMITTAPAAPTAGYRFIWLGANQSEEPMFQHNTTYQYVSGNIGVVGSYTVEPPREGYACVNTTEDVTYLYVQPSNEWVKLNLQSTDWNLLVQESRDKVTVAPVVASATGSAAAHTASVGERQLVRTPGEISRVYKLQGDGTTWDVDTSAAGTVVAADGVVMQDAGTSVTFGSVTYNAPIHTVKMFSVTPTTVAAGANGTLTFNRTYGNGRCDVVLIVRLTIVGSNGNGDGAISGRYEGTFHLYTGIADGSITADSDFTDFGAFPSGAAPVISTSVTNSGQEFDLVVHNPSATYPLFYSGHYQADETTIVANS